MKSLLLLALGLARTVVLGARIEAERIVVSVRPYKREQRRCPVCGRACDFYDMANRGAPRLWRAMDLARSACYLEYAPCRVRCPEHGVRTEAVPWARHGARFTRDFEDWVAWLAVRCTASAVSELARVEWHSVGGVCRRVYAELEAARGASRFDGVRRIGIDETSYKKGHKYVTVVVDHDRGCLIWAHEGTGKDVLNLFLDELTREQRRAIEVVTADGARWIRQLVKRRCPNARWVMDPFHVVQWMNDALDAVRCEEWNAARAAARAARPRPEGKRGRPAKGELDWQHLFGRFREGQPRLPELDRRHVAQRRVDPEVVVPVHVVRELGPELARRAERLAVDELGLQYPVGRLVDGVVVGAALGRQRPLNAEGLEHQVDLGVVELAAAVRVEDLDVRDGEGERRERRLDQPGVLPGPGGVADDLPVVEVDEQADVVPRGPDAHVGQVAAYMGARRPAAEAARDDVGHVGLVDRPGVHLEPLPAVCADQAVLPHDAADPAPADGDARPLERRLYLARAVPALAGGVGRDHGRRGGVRRGGPVGPRAHGVVRRPRDAEEPALR